MAVVVLYHGTDADAAAALLADGWMPRAAPAGGQCGDPGRLYLTTDPANALWYAGEKGGAAVLAVEIDTASLIVDPEDGVGDTVEAELAPPHGLPGNLAATAPLPAAAFARWVPEAGFAV